MVKISMVKQMERKLQPTIGIYHAWVSICIYNWGSNDPRSIGSEGHVSLCTTIERRSTMIGLERPNKECILCRGQKKLMVPSKSWFS